MDNGFLRIGSSVFVADSRSGPIAKVGRFIIMRGIAKAIFPRPPYLVVTNVVALKIVHDREIGCRKAPDAAYPRTVGIEVINLIDPPIVTGIPLK